MTGLQFSRRSFLVSLLAGSGAVLLASPTQSILAANEPQATKALRPDFVDGTLVAVSHRSLTLRVPGYTPEHVDILLDPKTQICRGSCSATWTALKVDDRIATATYFGSTGARVARWVNANTVAGMAVINAINGSVLTVRSMGYGGGQHWDLSIEPYTTVIPLPTNGKKEVGSARSLKTGDSIHFTGFADSPDYSARSVWAYLIHQLGMPKHA